MQIEHLLRMNCKELYFNIIIGEGGAHEARLVQWLPNTHKALASIPSVE